jgi:hypothetical protein
VSTAAAFGKHYPNTLAELTSRLLLLEKCPMPPKAAPHRMKMGPEARTRRRRGHPPQAQAGTCLNSPPVEGCRGGLSGTGRTHPEGYAFCPSLEGIFTGASRQAKIISSMLDRLEMALDCHRQKI